jgi:hypothetical protein
MGLRIALEAVGKTLTLLGSVISVMKYNNYMT